MIGKAKLKEIKSLEQKKFRKRTGRFVAEGHKLVLDLLSTFQPCYFVATHSWLEAHPHALPTNVECDAVSADELQRISLQQNPQDVLAVFCIPESAGDLCQLAGSQLVLALDGVQDPGNLGTIVRIADWFGIEHVFCSRLSADIYNPKSVQATMGAMARVKVHYTDLVEQLQNFKGPIYGTFLDGDNLYDNHLQQRGVVVMGNEGNGISMELASLVNARLLIPPYPGNRQTSESLNVAVATAIVCAEFRRQANA